MEFNELIGLTLKEVKGLEERSDEVSFVTEDGRTLRMYHDQDCCESVSIESVTGDVADLIGSPILVAEESSSDEWPEGAEKPDYLADSYTWTFYKIATVKGWVDIRWYGCSNGYYSEGVDCKWI